ncbi:NPCBM/NEW2 domain-containing protein [Luteolibacter sp. LG18]|uniref:NPCBM/NEW2 domain-containing protein n=1 Tax=Luteolibacter sp. LG18 TaxID=2819286 RepID=UPI002B318B3C|nr:glycosyhydrolase [Luteolibacter sp. LG18]
MIRILPIVLLALPASALTPKEEIAAQVAAARPILDGWQNQNPERAQRKLHIVYWSPSDREPAPRYRERLSTIMEDIRKFYAEEMEKMGFGPRTFALDHAADGLINIHVIKGRQPYAHYDVPSGDEIRNECKDQLAKEGVDLENETIVLFCNMSNWDPEKRTISQNSPYYASGTNRRGCAWQVDSPILELSQLANKGDKVQDGQYGNISLGRYNSIFIGGIAHELGHALSLPHNQERHDQHENCGIALMGSGNREYRAAQRGEGLGSFITLAHGLRLASHPLFCGSVKGMKDQPTAAPSDLSIKADGKALVVSGKVTSKVPVYGVVAYFDPAGGGDYDAPTATAVPDKDGRFTLTGNDLVAGKSGELRLFFLEANGIPSGFLSQTPYAWSYLVKPDGTADVSAIEAAMTLKPLFDVASQGGAAATAAFGKIDFSKSDPVVKQAATSLVRAASKTAPLPVPADEKGAFCALTTARWTSAKTGYGAASSGMLPEAPWVFAAGGRLFPDGLYAHAPATYTWQLGGTWKTLSGSCGLIDGRDGSVGFRITGDGKELFKAAKVKDGKVHDFKIDVTGVKELQLLTDDGGDDVRSDWGAWLAPVLTR